MTDPPAQEDDRTAPDDLVVLVVAGTAVAAQALAAAIRSRGIDATAIEVTDFEAAFPSRAGVRGTPVCVASSDLEAARRMLDEMDHEDESWDDVDVGEREDDLPLTPPGRVPWPARIAWVVVASMILMMLMLFVLMVVT